MSLVDTALAGGHRAEQQHVRGPRAALVFTGFLRGTCHGSKSRHNISTGIAALREQLVWCRIAFFNRCDVFLHSWSTTHKAPSFSVRGDSLGNYSRLSDLQLTNKTAVSSWKCVEAVRNALGATTVAVEDQTPPSADRLADLRAWGTVGENLFNMRMQMASVLGGLQLMSRHAVTTGIEYHAVARMRADIGDASWRETRPEWFLNEAGWRTIRRRADLLFHNSLPTAKSNELVMCGHPRYKQTDFCNWSVPPAPMMRAVAKLNGASFDQTVYGGEGCEAYLTKNFTDASGRAIRVPAVSENILYCAMREAGVTPSLLIDMFPCGSC